MLPHFDLLSAASNTNWIIGCRGHIIWVPGVVVYGFGVIKMWLLINMKGVACKWNEAPEQLGTDLSSSCYLYSVAGMLSFTNLMDAANKTNGIIRRCGCVIWVPGGRRLGLRGWLNCGHLPICSAPRINETGALDLSGPKLWTFLSWWGCYEINNSLNNLIYYY